MDSTSPVLDGMEHLRPSATDQEIITRNVNFSYLILYADLVHRPAEGKYEMETEQRKSRIAKEALLTKRRDLAPCDIAFIKGNLFSFIGEVKRRVRL